MSRLAFKNFCAVFMALAFTFTVIGSPSQAQAQSQEKLEKANSISNLLVVGALVLVAVAVIVTVSKGDKKDKEGEKKDTEEQAMRQNPVGHVWQGTSSLNSRTFVSSEYEAGETKWKPGNGSALRVQNAFLQPGCLMFAHEME